MEYFGKNTYKLFLVRVYKSVPLKRMYYGECKRTLNDELSERSENKVIYFYFVYYQIVTLFIIECEIENMIGYYYSNAILL